FVDVSGSRDGARAGRRMQTENEARRAVEILLSTSAERFVDDLPAGRYKDALERMGAALHTVQDREYHYFEPWPFTGIADAFLHATRGDDYGLQPDYMFSHGLRDVGYVNGPLSLSLTAFDYSASYESSRGWAAAGRMEVTQTSNSPWMPHLTLGAAGRLNG